MQDHKYRKLNKYPSPTLRAQFKTSEKQYKKVLDKALKTYKKELGRKLRTLRSNNTKEYWKILNQRDNARQPDISFDKLFDFFKKLNSLDSEEEEMHNFSIFELEQTHMENLNETINREISREEILKCIKNLKNDKACADDQIANEYIKSTSNTFIDIYM